MPLLCYLCHEHVSYITAVILMPWACFLRYGCVSYVMVKFLISWLCFSCHNYVSYIISIFLCHEHVSHVIALFLLPWTCFLCHSFAYFEVFTSPCMESFWSLDIGLHYFLITVVGLSALVAVRALYHHFHQLLSLQTANQFLRSVIERELLQWF